MSPTLLAEERPVARKSHGCNACLGLIQAGETYARQRVADGSEAWTWKGHLLCESVDHHLRREAGWYDEEGPDPEEVHEVLRDLLGGLLGQVRA